MALHVVVEVELLHVVVEDLVVGPAFLFVDGRAKLPVVVDGLRQLGFELLYRLLDDADLLFDVEQVGYQP